MRSQAVGGFFLVAICVSFAAGYFAASQPVKHDAAGPAVNAPANNRPAPDAGQDASDRSERADGGGSDSGQIAAYFSPDGGATAAIVRELQAARKSIDVQAYSFTSQAIARALADAHRRGVAVRVILDREAQEDPHSQAEFIRQASVPTFYDAQHSIAHSKVMLIDGRTVITGSFNFTNAAERYNAENVLIIHDDPRLYATYEANFRRHLGHSDTEPGPIEQRGGRNRRSNRD